MSFMLMSSVLMAFFFADTTLSLQVSSKSPCSLLCLDSPSQNLTGSTTSNTYGSDIICVDSDYANTPNGERFMSCLTCLQTSTSSDESGSDQEWFLYNLRFAVDTCLFGFPNASSPVTTPCSTSQTCGPLQTALENGNLLPSNESEFSYCSADDGAFLGTYLSKCKECLTTTSNETYLSNFLTALEAGCLQQPPTGTIIGINGTVFSSTPIVIKSSGSNQAPSPTATSKHKKGLTQAAIIGMAVGLAVLLMVAIAVFFICSRKRYNLNRMKKLKSPLNAQFGAPNITSPTNGIYGVPYSKPPVSVNDPLDSEEYSKPHSNSRDMQEASWHDSQTHLAGQLTPQSGASIQTPSAPSPASLSGSSDTYQMRPYPSARACPKNVPPPLVLQQSDQTSHWQMQETTQVQQPQPVAAPQHSPPRIHPSSAPTFEYHPLFGDDGPPVIERPPSRSLEFRPSSRTQGANVNPEYRPPSRTQTKPLPEYSPPSRPGSRTEYRPPSRTQTKPLPEYIPPSRPGSRTENRARGESRTRGVPCPESESSRIYPPGPHSQFPALETRPPSRSHSRNESWKRAISGRIGLGNANDANEIPVHISGPMIKHGGRFDFEFAEREKMERDRLEGKPEIRRLKKEGATPDSANSGEQWPGLY